jgi:FHA domain
MSPWIKSSNDTGTAIPFVTRLPEPSSHREAPPTRGSTPPVIPTPRGPKLAPTHVLCDGRAYPITSLPFYLGLQIPAGRPGINLTDLGGGGSTAGISRSHCSIYQVHDAVLIEDHSSFGTYLNDRRVEGRATLAAGDRLRLGTPGIELRVIRVEDEDGTP